MKTKDLLERFEKDYREEKRKEAEKLHNAIAQVLVDNKAEIQAVLYVLEMLKFDEADVENLLRTHSSNQSYWEALSVRLKMRYERFKEEWQRKWWAHTKFYARYVLAAYGDSKPTVDTIKDMVIQIYSVETTEKEFVRQFEIHMKSIEPKFMKHLQRHLEHLRELEKEHVDPQKELSNRESDDSKNRGP